MFSKKPQLAAQTATPAQAPGAAERLRRIAALPVANPYVGVGAAGVLLLSSLGLLVALGDPLAGAPKVRVGLGEAPEGQMPGLDHGFGYGEFDASGIEMIPLDQLSASDGPYEAVITLPNGEQQVVALGGGNPLPAAPMPGLTEPGAGGLLPVIAPDGRTPAQAYARPFRPNGKPMVSVVIGGLGIDPVVTRQAIEQLPADVTLSFAARDVDNLQSWIDLARAHGHEVLIEIPMEPSTFPRDDPGPGALMTNLSSEETLSRLDTLLARGTGYFGVANYMGSKYLTHAPSVDALAAGLRRRGLAFVDDGAGARAAGGVPRASADRMIDEQLGVDAIGFQLTQLEQAAGNRGRALGAGMAYPVTIRQVAAWSRDLDARGFQLAPASALTVRR